MPTPSTPPPLLQTHVTMLNLSYTPPWPSFTRHVIAYPPAEYTHITIMRNAVIATDTTPHYTTPTPYDPTPSTTRPTSLAVRSLKHWHAYVTLNDIPTDTAPFTHYPLLTSSGLISYPHNPSQHDPYLTTLSDNVHTGLIFNHLHKAITDHIIHIYTTLPHTENATQHITSSYNRTPPPHTSHKPWAHTTSRTLTLPSNYSYSTCTNALR